MKCYNTRIISKNKNIPKATNLCNCGIKSESPLEINCLRYNVVYDASENCKKKETVYVGITGGSFETRYNNHLTTSFQNDTP